MSAYSKTGLEPNVFHITGEDRCYRAVRQPSEEAVDGQEDSRV